MCPDDACRLLPRVGGDVGPGDRPEVAAGRFDRMASLVELQSISRERTEVVGFVPRRAIALSRNEEALAIQELLEKLHLRVNRAKVEILRK